MDLHTPSKWTFWLSVVLVVLAIVSAFVEIPYLSKYELWVAVVGYVVLVIGCTLKTA
jgi:FtsH-binding integral membrane protein